jgi:hypothetical protein
MSRPFGNTAKCRYLGKAVANKNCIDEEIKFEECVLTFASEPEVVSSAI